MFASLLIRTAGRCLLAPEPRAGSKATMRISPRLMLGIFQPANDIGVPQLGIGSLRPLLECASVGILEIRGSKQPNCPVESRRPGGETFGVGVGIEELDVIVAQADTEFHTRMLPGVGLRYYHCPTMTP